MHESLARGTLAPSHILVSDKNYTQTLSLARPIKVQRPGASPESFSLKQQHACGKIKNVSSSSSIKISCILKLCSVKGISVRLLSL